ncbi:MAG: hypothetical protein HUK08_08440 [Bacteroidaceae bacterium]|nr:hypothetical protein [Bacteroidaceae bacterium]
MIQTNMVYVTAPKDCVLLDAEKNERKSMLINEEALGDINVTSEAGKENVEIDKPQVKYLKKLEAEEGKTLTDGHLTAKTLYCVPDWVERVSEVDAPVEQTDGGEPEQKPEDGGEADNTATAEAVNP